MKIKIVFGLGERSCKKVCYTNPTYFGYTDEQWMKLGDDLKQRTVELYARQHGLSVSWKEMDE